MCFGERQVKHMSIRLRLTLWYSGLLAATLAIFGITIYLFINWNIYSDLKEQLKNQDRNIGVVIGITNFLEELDLDLDRQSRIEGKSMFIQLVNYLSLIHI